MNRPLSLTVGVILLWVAAAVALISGFDLMGSALEMARAGVAEHLETTLRELGVNDVAGSLLIVGVFIAGVAIAGLALVRILVSSYLLRGQRWARIVITILIGINLLTGFAYLIEGYVMRMLFTVPLDIAILVLIFTSQSSAFIKARTASIDDETTVSA